MSSHTTKVTDRTEMYALIYFSKSRTIGVVSEDFIKKSSKGKTLVKWEEKWYSADILKKSGK